jgi:hypothetical protein
VRVSISGLTLQNGTFGIRAGGARVTVLGSVIRDNASSGIGDGCEVYCPPPALRLVLEDSAITGNGASGDTYGTAVDLQESRSRATITRCTLSGNTAPFSFSSAVYVRRGVVQLTDSTVSGNTPGHGIWFGWETSVPYNRPHGIGRITRSTVTNNGLQGVHGDADVNRVTIEGSIFANNAGEDCASANLTVTTRGFNLIETGCSGRQGRPDLDLTGVDPQLGPLQDNGGPTETHALLPGSPALGVVDRGAKCREPDQRGVARVAPCDIGAYEAP